MFLIICLSLILQNSIIAETIPYDVLGTNNEDLIEYRITSDEKIRELHTIYTEEEILLLCQCVWTEDRGGTYEGKRAVAECILNRVESPYFPDTIKEVILAPNQFEGSANYSQLEFDEEILRAVNDALYKEDMYPDNMLFFKAKSYWQNAKYGEYIDYKNIDGNYFSLYEIN